MEKLKPLVIGDLTAKVPIIQGGMGVGISLHSLAGAVAKAGGIGLISTAQIGFREPDFRQKPLEANLRAIGKELKKAREIAPGGILGFNIMVATHDYALYVKEAVKAGADIIVSGAGLPVDLPGLIEGFKTKIAPIVSTAKSANVICKLWDRKYKRVPDLVVIEGPLAGGIYDRSDVERAMELGVDAVQVATRFVTTEECDAPLAYKEAYINAKKEDIVITKSPVGMPGRAIMNPFLENVGKTPFKLEWCYQCLEHCDRKTIPYCITKALIDAAEGDVENSLLFCGSNAYRAEKIETVPDVMRELCGE